MESVPKKVKPVSYKAYVDPTGEFPSQELGYAFWYIKHKVLLYKLLVAFLVSASAIFWLYSLIKWTGYLAYGIADDKKLGILATQFIDYTGLHPRYAPKPLSVLSSTVYQGGTNKYDAVAEVSNPNNRFLAKFDYYFVVDGTSTPKQQRALMPNENSFLVFGGIESGFYPGSAVLQVENLKWQRISNHKVSNTETWQNERLNLEVSEFSFDNGIGETALAGNRIKFELINNSAYGFVEPDFYVGFYSGANLVQVLPLHLKVLESLKKVNVDLRSFLQNINVDSVKVYPKINLYDHAVYLPPPR